MKNTLIDGHEASDIRQQVQKIIRGLGNPEPPLELDYVRELLRLDRAYYSSDDQRSVSEVVNRLTVAGKQVLKRPTILWDAIKKASLSALWIPDKKRILIDESKPKLKHRWSEAHEIGHSIIPWHQQLLLGDNEFSLNPTCHKQLESEANFAAGQLLFLQERFTEEACDLSCDLETVKHLKNGFGNTLTSTLWRYVEEAHQDLPMFGLVSQHPNRPGADFDPSKPCRYFIRSPKFAEQFSKATEIQLFRIIGTYCGHQRGGPLGAEPIMLRDDNGKRHVFHFESFSNRYDVLTLGRYLRPKRVSVAT